MRYGDILNNALLFLFLNDLTHNFSLESIELRIKIMMLQTCALLMITKRVTNLTPFVWFKYCSNLYFFEFGDLMERSIRSFLIFQVSKISFDPNFLVFGFLRNNFVDFSHFIQNLVRSNCKAIFFLWNRNVWYFGRQFIR